MCGMIQAFCGLGFGQMLVVLGIFGVAIFGILVLAYQFVWSRGCNVGKKYGTEQAEQRAFLATRRNVAGRITNELNRLLAPHAIASRKEDPGRSLIQIFRKNCNSEPFYEAEVTIAGDKIMVLYSGQREQLWVRSSNDSLLENWIKKFSDVVLVELRA